MSRTLSVTALTAMAAQQTGEVPLYLLEIAHDDLVQPIRVSSDAVATTHNGNSYIAYPFSLTLPEEGDQRPPKVSLTIDNVDRSIVRAIRSIGTAPTVTLTVVLASEPNTILCGPMIFSARAVSYDALSVTAELTYEEVLDEAWPVQTFAPSSHPGLF